MIASTAAVRTRTQRLVLCPSCSNKGRSVKPITIESLVTEAARARVGLTDGFRFCAEPSCNVAYFHLESGDRFMRSDVNVRIGQKETSAPRPVCYCFNHTVEDIADEVAKTGTSKIPDEITQKCRQGLDRCEETNPQGACCLGNVRQALKAAQTELSKKECNVYSEDCCAVDSDAAGQENIKMEPVVQRPSCNEEMPTQERSTRSSGHDRRSVGWPGLLAAIPSLGVALLPIGACVACWPVYAGLLSSIGLGFALDTTYLLPLMTVALLVALFSLAYHARARHGYGPLGLGVVAMGLVMVGKFALQSDAMLYFGLASLISASVWNAWPRRVGASCCT